MENIEQKLALVEKVPGLKEHLDGVRRYVPRGLLNGSISLDDLQVKPEEQAAAYIVEQHEWMASGCSGIEYSVEIGVFRQGKSTSSGKIVCRHMHNYRYDDWRKYYTKLKDFTITQDKVRVVVASKDAEGAFVFDL
ncbi:MAG TPA: hypothetical protein VJJ79_02280 [Candidatus Nanoarchaeia archaeon]|nr:hypothetical protein [Candidatus Nanoarchaeia archaeon]